MFVPGIRERRSWSDQEEAAEALPSFPTAWKRESWNIQAVDSRSHKKDQNRLGFGPMVSEDERLFSALQEPEADEEETLTEKRAAPLLSQDPKVLWLGFPMDPTHHSAHEGDFSYF